MSNGSIRPEEEHHTATGRTNRFRKGVAASVAGIPVKWRIRQIQSVGRLIKDESLIQVIVEIDRK